MHSSKDDVLLADLLLMCETNKITARSRVSHQIPTKYIKQTMWDKTTCDAFNWNNTDCDAFTSKWKLEINSRFYAKMRKKQNEPRSHKLGHSDTYKAYAHYFLHAQSPSGTRKSPNQFSLKNSKMDQQHSNVLR